MADNRLYGGEVVSPAMLGVASPTPKQQSLSGYTGSGSVPYIDNSKNLEYDPYHRLKMSFLDTLGKTFDKAIENEKNMAYVKGMSSQISGIAEDAMETNMLTRAWSKAGYRDMEGRMALINYKATVLKDLESGKLDDLTPDQFQEYLNKQRENLMPFISNSSMLIRDKLLERTIEEDVGLIQKQSARYEQAIYQKELNAWQMDFALQLMDLDASAGSYAYNTAINNVGSTIGMLMINDRIDQGNKVKMATEVLQNMAYAGHVEAARQLRDAPIIPYGDEYLPLRALLTPEEDFKLQKVIQAGYTKNKDQLTLATAFEWAGMESAWKQDPTMLTPDYVNQRTSDLFGSVLDGTMSKGQAVSYLKSMLNWANKGQDSLELLSMYIRGDNFGIHAAGGTVSQGRDEFIKYIENLAPTEQLQAVQQLIAAGQNDGYAISGMLITPTISRYMLGGEPEPRDQEIFNFLINTYNTGRYQSSKIQTLNGLLSGMPEDEAIFLRSVFEAYQQPITNDPKAIGEAWSNAMAITRATMLDDSSARKSNIGTKLRETGDLIDEKINSSVRNTLWLPDIITGLGSKGGFRNSQISQELWNSKGMENANQSQLFFFNTFMKDEAKRILNGHPYMTPDQAYEQAMINVAANAYAEENDNYKMTFISDPRSPVLNLLADVKSTLSPQELMQSTVGELVKDAISRDSRAKLGSLDVAVRYENGVMTVSLFDESTGNLLQNIPYSNEDVRAMGEYTSNMMDLARLNNVDVEVKAGTADTVSHETASWGRPHQEKIKINPHLDWEYEGKVPWDGTDIISARLAVTRILPTSREIKSDKSQVVGVGLYPNNPYYPTWLKDGGKLTDAEFDSLFMQSTSQAMAVANEVARPLAINGNETAYKAFLTVLSLSNPSKMLDPNGEYAPVLDAIENRDMGRASEELFKTSIYKSLLKAQEEGRGNADELMKLMMSIYN